MSPKLAAGIPAEILTISGGKYQTKKRPYGMPWRDAGHTEVTPKREAGRVKSPPLAAYA